MKKLRRGNKYHDERAEKQNQLCIFEMNTHTHSSSFHRSLWHSLFILAFCFVNKEKLAVFHFSSDIRSFKDQNQLEEHRSAPYAPLES